MSFYTSVAEIGEGDRIQVRTGPECQPERMWDTTVSIVGLLDGDSTIARQVTVPPNLAGTVVVLVCSVTSEVPSWVLEHIRDPAPAKLVLTSRFQDLLKKFRNSA